MADTFDFESEYESEADTLDGAPPRQIVDEEAAVKRHLYSSHRTVTRADGTPIIAEESAQAKFERQQRETARRAARAAAAQAVKTTITEDFSGEEAGDAADPMDEALNDLTEQRRAIEATLTEAEKRFDKAKYYKLILSNPLINDSSEAGQEVEAEIRTFAQERFEVFLGMRAEREEASAAALPSAFREWEPEDFQTLQALIRRIRQKPELSQGPAAPPPHPPHKPRSNHKSGKPEPRVNPIQAQPRPQSTKVVAAKTVTKKKGPPPKPGKRILKALVNPMDGKPVMNSFTGKQATQDITPQVAPTTESPYQPIPMPQGRDAIEMMHASKAQEGANMAAAALAKAGKSGIKLRTAIAYSQLTGSEGNVVFDGASHVHDPMSSVTVPEDLK
jgi:hypothetical protein